jgi:hypothetical protein
MRQGSMNTSDNKEYISSDRWKCEKSPTGAHHWIVHTYEATCKYCDQSKSTNIIPPVDLNPKSSNDDRN